MLFSKTHLYSSFTSVAFTVYAQDIRFYECFKLLFGEIEIYRRFQYFHGHKTNKIGIK